MDSIKRRLIPLLLSLALLCSCTAGTADNSPGTSPSEPAPSQVQTIVSPSPSPSETATSQPQPAVSPSPSAAEPEPSPITAVLPPEPSPSTAPVSESPAAAVAEDPVEVTVYVTRTGEKYHTDGCQYLRKSQIPISLEDAKASGYTPCSKCHPPR